MNVIRCDADFTVLQEQGILSDDVLKVVEQYYLELKEAVSEDDEAFWMDGGPIVVIDPERDDWQRILEVEQPIWIEYADLIESSTGTQVFRVGRMLDNEMMIYFLQAGVNREADEWLKGHM